MSYLVQGKIERAQGAGTTLCRDQVEAKVALHHPGGSSDPAEGPLTHNEPDSYKSEMQEMWGRLYKLGLGELLFNSYMEKSIKHK